VSIKILSSVWEHSRHTGGQLLVLLAIADFANDHAEAFPSVKTLAKKSRLSVRTTQRALGKLCQSGELKIKPQKGPKGCHRYHIQLQPQDDKLSGVTNCRSDIRDIHGVAPLSSEPSKNRHIRKGGDNMSSQPQHEEGWNQFWAVYPKRLAKKDARRAWDKLVPDQNLVPLILKKLALAKSSDQWAKDSGKYIPFPATWLNGRRWEDELPTRNSKKEPLPL